MEQPHDSSRFLDRALLFVARGFGSGASPYAPGTAGSLVGVVLYLLLRPLDTLAYVAVVAACFGAGIYLCGRAAAMHDDPDPPGIVWDEIVGFCTVMIAAPPGWYWIAVGFLVFRALDIFKPWPISWCDRRVKGGLGIMLDDLAAGLIGCALLQLCQLVLTRLGLL